MFSQSPFTITPAVDRLREPDLLRLIARVDEFRGVLEDQHRAARRREARSRRGEVPRENALLGDPIVVEKAVRRFRPGPVPTGGGNGGSRCSDHPRDDPMKAPDETLIRKRASIQFHVRPIAFRTSPLIFHLRRLPPNQRRRQNHIRFKALKRDFAYLSICG